LGKHTGGIDEANNIGVKDVKRHFPIRNPAVPLNADKLAHTSVDASMDTAADGFRDTAKHSPGQQSGREGTVVAARSAATVVAALALVALVGFTGPPSAAQAATEGNVSWSEVAQRLQQNPVNAQVHRVWKAIPGLCGSKLDVAASQRATAGAKDGQVHLRWLSVQPSVRLSDLPPQPVYRGPSAEKSASLMFNVSWGTEYVPQLLAVLQATHTKATFFLDGDWVRQNPGMAKQLAVAGEDLGSHGQGHRDFRALSTEDLQRQLFQSANLIRQATGTTVHLLAPPAGSYDQRIVSLARQQGVYVILWSLDTLDWRRPPATEIIQRVNRGVEPGVLILMHPTAPTVAALPEIIRSLQNRGYLLKTVSQVTGETPATAPPSTLSGTL